MKILITGATGFIGKRIALKLAEGGTHDIIATGRNAKRAKDFKGKSKIQFVAMNLNSAEEVKSAVGNIDVIIHSAGLAGTWGTYQSYYEANVHTTKNLLEVAKSCGTSRFINLSSPSIYFNFKDQYQLKETYLPPKYSNHYAHTKHLGEQLVQAAHSKALMTVSLRPRFVIGAGDTNIIPRMIRLQKAGLLRQIGAGNNIVDVTSVTNLVQAIELCLSAPFEHMGEVYNISNGAPINFWQFVDKVLDSAGVQTTRKKVPYWVAMSAARINERFAKLVKKKEEPRLLPISVAVLSHSMTLDISKAKERLGYRPLQSTEQGIEEFTRWYQKESPTTFAS